MRLVLAALCVLALVAGLRACSQRPIARADGVIAAAVPVQKEASDAAVIEHGIYRLQPLADFEVEARVLAREDYAWDAGAALAPIDLALGWARMSDTAVLERLDISQGARFYTYRWRGEPPIPVAEIVRSSANMHLIPADEGIARVLERVRVGAVVTLRGRLVEARRDDGWRWRSSLSREDSGGGACELLLVEAASID